MKILHVSDLHFGDSDTIEEFEKEFENFINIIQSVSSKIDYIFMTGDMVFFSTLKKSYEFLDFFLSKIKQIFAIPNNNIFYVTGNHENISIFDKHCENYNLFCKLIHKHCNKRCKKYCFNKKIERYKFSFYNSIVIQENGKIMMLKKGHCNRKNILVQHGSGKYYKKYISNDQIICGHKIKEHKDYQGKIKKNSNFQFLVGSEDGFCSHNYLFGIYDFNENIIPLFCKSR